MSEIKKYKNIPFFKKYKSILIFIMLFAFVWWIIAFLTIPKESSPEIDLPNYVVSAVYPWWDPETIEAQIINRLESKFSSISWLKELKWTAAYNIWIVSLEFFEWKTKQDAINDIKDAIDSVKSSLPDWVNDPVVKKVNIDDAPIYTFSVTWKYMTSLLYKKVKYLEDDLKKIQWISDIVVVWKVNPEIKLIVDYDKLNHYNIDYWFFINQVQELLKKVPADKKNIDWNTFSFELSSYENDINKVYKEIKNFNLLNINWNIVKVSDVANVYIGNERETKKSFVYNTDWTSYWAITFQVKKVPWADILGIINQVKTYLSLQEKKLQSENIKFYEVLSQKEKIDNTYDTFISNFRQTSIFIFLIIILFIWWKESVALTIAFPLVYLVTFLFLYFIWYSFNMIVSFSLILTLWIMVDSLIVIIEWYDDWIKRWLTKNKALIYTINTYRQPLISWTLTTIVMFLPLYFMLSWMIWKFMNSMPVTIVINLTISIIVSLVFLPVIINLINFKKKVKEEENNIKKESVHWDISKFVSPFIRTKKQALATVISFWLLFIFIISLVVLKVIKVDFMSPIDSNNITVNINYTPWIDLEKNRELTYGITKKINDFMIKSYPGTLEYIWVDLWVKSSWDPVKNAMYWTSWSDNYSTLTIKLADKDNKRKVDWSKYKAYSIKENVQKFVDNNIHSKYLKELTVTSAKAWPWAWKPISFNIVWDNLKMISDYIDIIYPQLQKINWTYNWGTGLEYTNWKIKIIWDYNKLKQYNLTASRVNLLLMWMKNTPNYVPNWLTITKLYDLSDEELRVKTYMNYSWNIEDLKIWWVYLSNFIKEIKFVPELKTIDHLNTKISILIDSDQTSWVPLSIITEWIKNVIKNNPMPEWLKFVYSSDIKEQQSSWKDMWMSFLVWLILMFWVLVFQFNNFRYPLLILWSLPLLLIWAFGLLWILWQTFSFASQIGMFWLIWVWVNTSILLLESYWDKLERDWKFSVNLLLETVNSRVKPIFLTTLTTTVWLITLALKDEMWAWLGIAFMWGLLFWTVMVVLYIPAILRLGNKENK